MAKHTWDPSLECRYRGVPMVLLLHGSETRKGTMEAAEGALAEAGA